MPTPPRLPAVPVDQSVTPDGKSVVCLECGQAMALLKRHLRFDHDLNEDDYRARWGLAPNHPLVAPALGKARAEDGWGVPAEAVKLFASSDSRATRGS